MASPDKPSRRKLLAAAAAAGVAGVAGGLLWWRRTREEPARPIDHAARPSAPLPPDPDFPNTLRLPGTEGMYGVIDVAAPLTIVAKSVRHALVPGKPAAMLAYEVEHRGRTFLNPVFRIRTGTPFRAKLWNALDETSIIHWHGFKVDSNNDGHPHYAVPGGATYDYHFTVANRAGTYWYHPHPHHLTGKQVYLGLAGFFIVEDEDEAALQKALDLRLGVTDLPVVIQDRTLDAAGQLIFAPTADESFDGVRGSEVLVNGTPRPHLDLETRIYRFRILNGSNARMYRLAFRQDGRLLDFHVIGTDGGLLDRPYAVKDAFLAPAERVDVLLDLRAAATGGAVTLSSLAFDPMEHEEGGGEHMAHAGHHAAAPEPAQAQAGQPAVPEEGSAIDFLRVRVREPSPYDRKLPQTLSRLEPAADAQLKPRIMTLDVYRKRWRINRMSYDMRATPIVVKRGAVEVWEIRNAKRSMPHPLHIHGFQFRVLSRQGSPEQQSRLAITATGLAATDLGWKDTVLAWPGETVRIAIDFSHPFPGDQVYMVHCHNLEHEDGGMMLNLKVAA
jgi:blue copper oxidase